jgi:hypothetical protein
MMRNSRFRRGDRPAAPVVSNDTTDHQAAAAPRAATAKYAAVVTYDGVASLAMATAVKKADGTTAVVDSGTSSYRLPGEVTEAYAGLIAEGYAAQANVYPDDLLQHAQDDALTLAGSL